MSISNVDIFKKWIKMTRADWQAVESAIETNNRGIAVFHIQLFVEKMLKSFIVFFGKEPSRTHFPSKQLVNIINDQSHQIKGTERPIWEKIIQEIAFLASTIEDERTRPRYGIRYADDFIIPDELYSSEDIELFLSDARKVTELIIQFLSLLPLADQIADEIGLLESFL